MHECMNMSSSCGEKEEKTFIREVQKEESAGRGDCLDMEARRWRCPGCSASVASGGIHSNRKENGVKT